jgi:hypothetical protein
MPPEIGRGDVEQGFGEMIEPIEPRPDDNFVTTMVHAGASLLRGYDLAMIDGRYNRGLAAAAAAASNADDSSRSVGDRAGH